MHFNNKSLIYLLSSIFIFSCIIVKLLQIHIFMDIKALFLVLLVLSLGSTFEENIRFKDGQMMRKHHSEPAPNVDNLIVHVIPHSHDDVGWLKTVDDYYYGANQNIQWAGVQYTIDTVVSELASNPNYKFSIVEMAFLYRWWSNANETERQKMRNLVKNGQLEFINGGWCMSDEATPYYQDIIDQMTIGLRWLKNTLDFVPDVAWHIDPFGHQASSASMFSQMGFQSFFFARIDYQDKQKRMSQKGLEMIWRPNLTVSDINNYIFTHVNYYHYSPPPGFCFDVLCGNADPIRDDPNMQGYNLPEKATAFVNYFKSMSLHFRTKNLMHTFGEDFQYANARMWYKNLDKLMNYINSKPEMGVKFQYSTPSLYTKAVLAEGQSYPKKQDDFFPYSDGKNDFWTGYFTSRVAVKGFVRDMGRWVQAVRKHVSEIKIRGSEIIKNNVQTLEDKLWELETAMGILQHHDAVAGTEKQKVANDYIATALRNIDKFAPLYRQIIKEQVSQQIGQTPAEQNIFFNIYWNDTAKTTGVSQKLSNNKTILLALYNPGPAQKRQVKIYVPELDLKITSWTNSTIIGDIICTDTATPANCQLFMTLDFPESGNTYVKIVADSKSPSAKIVKLKQLTIIESAKQFKLSTSASIKITKSTTKFDLTLSGVTESFLINYNHYESYQGEGQKSGAYIFRPANDTSKKYSTVKNIHYAEGTEMVVITLEADKTYTKVYFSKIYDYVNTKGFEVETRIDSIDIGDKLGKEVTINFLTNYQNNKTFYTDSNGLEEQIRVLNYRPTWPLVVTQPTAGNYYPVNSHIGFKDISSGKKFTVLTDRSQGGSSLREGEIQLMIHRRLLMDDARGVGEPLNETESDGKGLIQNVRHYVVFGNNYRDVQKQNDQKVAISIIDTTTSNFAKHAPSAVAIPVPPTVKLYLRPFTDGSYLLRVQNFDRNQVSVSLPAGWEATEYTLAANQLLSDWRAKQYKWKIESTEQEQQIQQSTIFDKIKTWAKQLIPIQILPSSKSQITKQPQVDAITLNFLQIRTFKIVPSS